MARLSLEVFGQIGVPKWWDETGIEAADVHRALKDAGQYEGIDVWVNSFGGLANEGVAIYNLLTDTRKTMQETKPDFNINVEVIGVAYSAATLIMMAGDRRIIRAGANMMIHKAWTCFCGNADDCDREARAMRVVDSGIAEIYAKHGKGNKEHYLALMQDETFFDSDAALKEGFATEKNDSAKAAENVFIFEKGKYHETLSKTMNAKRFAQKKQEDRAAEELSAAKRKARLKELELLDAEASLYAPA